jgi:hypothetical protein
MLSGLLLSAALLADEPASPPVVDQPAALGAKPGVTQASSSRTMRLHLMEGSIVTGELSTDAITVETAFGKLKVPVANIVSFTPGLDSHPQEGKRIGRLIQQLGSNVATERDAAQRALADMGKSIQPELARYAQDEDTERRARVQKILAELEEADEDDEIDPLTARPWLAHDSVETTLFTVVGKISPSTFEVQTQFGPLTVAIGDIRRGERELDTKPEVRKMLAVTGDNLVPLNMQASGVRVVRGDKVQITAEGRLVMTPWGNNMFSTPDGGEQFQWYLPNQIPGGALVARVGTTGKLFKVGSKHTFTSNRTGFLYLGIAISPQFANQDYNYPGQYNVKIRVNAR